MSTGNTDLALLFEKYLAGNMTETESGTLAKMLEDDPAQAHQLRLQVETDYVLRIRFQQMAENRKKELPPEPTWDELVELQNAERPISKIVAEYLAAKKSPVRTFRWARSIPSFLRRCFLPNRRDWEESIAPVVTIFLVSLAAVAGLVTLGSRWVERPVEAIPLVARVNDTIDAVWSSGAQKYTRGEHLNAGRLQLTSGLVQLEMKNGTKVTLQGPVDLSVESPMRAYCRSGCVSVRVPRAGHGYRIETPFGDVVDRGTEFFLDVTEEAAQVDVVQGRVDYVPQSQKTLALVALDSLFCDRAQRISVHKRNVDIRYTGTEAFDLKSREQAAKIRQAQEEKDRQDGSPRCLARLDFQQGKPWRLRTCVTAELEVQPRLLGGFWGDGPVSGTTALVLHDPNDGVSLNVDGRFQTLTLEATVRIPTYIQTTNVLLASKQFLTQSNTILWQLTDRGVLNFQVSRGEGLMQPYRFESSPSADLLRPGSWVSLSIKIDIPNRRVVQSMNGHVIGVSTWNGPDFIKIDRSVLGNVDVSDRTTTNRCFGGSIAEFKITTDDIL